jgi:hypothetical protein
MMPYIYYNIEDMNNINIDINKNNIITNIYMIHKNEKSSTLIKYSELTKYKFMNILCNNMNLIKIVIIDNIKKYDFFVNPFLLIDYINKNNIDNIRYYFNKKIYIDLNSDIGIKLINKCNDLLKIHNSLYIQSIIILKLNNKNENDYKNILINRL